MLYVRNFILILLLCMGFTAAAQSAPPVPEATDISSALALDDPFAIAVTNCGTNIPIVRLATVGQLTGGTVICAWNPSPSSNVTGYYVYVDPHPITNYTKVFYDVGTNLYYKINNLNRGLTNYLAVTAYNSDRNQSPVSSNFWILAPQNYLTLTYSNSVSFTNVFYGSNSPSNYANYTYTPHVCLSFVSDPFRIYTLLWTTNFLNWNVLQSYTNYPNQITTFTDTNPTTPQKFYSLKVTWPQL